MEEHLQNFVGLSSPDPLEHRSQNSGVARLAQPLNSSGGSQVDTTDITMPSNVTTLFTPPAFTRDLFNEYVDEDDDNAIEDGPEVTVLSSTQKPDSHTLLPVFDEQMSRSTPLSDDGWLFRKANNDHNDKIDGDGHNYDDDDEVAVFASRIKRPRSFRPNSSTQFATPTVVPTLTQQGRRLPKHLRSGYRRGQQDIIMGRDFQEFDYTPSTSRRRAATPSYGHVHTTLPVTNAIPTGGGGYLITNSFMSSAQRKRLEQQESIEKVLTDLDDCLAASPADYKLRAKKLHLEELQRRLMNPDQGALKGAEASLIKDVEKMLSRRRMNMVKAEFENQAKAMVENMSSAGAIERKRAYDQTMGSLTPLSSDWSEAAAPSERSSFSHHSTGGKTVPPSYYHRHTGGDFTHTLEGYADAGDESEAGKDDGEDVVWDGEQGRKTYGRKTVAQGNAVSRSDMNLVKEGSGDEKDEDAEDDSGDDVGGSSDDNTDDERDIDDKGKGDRVAQEIDDRKEGSSDEDVDPSGKGDESNEDEMQKETEKDGGNGDANE